MILTFYVPSESRGQRRCVTWNPDGEIENSGKYKKYFSQLFHGSGLAESQPLPLEDSLGQKL